ncbi:MAG: transposase [Kangiellaceae bacterium]|jgi:histone-lysine N-methyltransferase SETMAR|nr:transposase [Kangiellaceae bacterium]
MELNREHLRVLIWYCFKRRLPATEAHEELQDTLEDQAPSFATVTRWYREFRGARGDFADDPRSGRPSTAVTQENIASVQAMIDEDPRVTTAMIGEHVGIGSAAVDSILHSHLKVRKLCARWIPHVLTGPQKQARIDFCRLLIDQFETASPQRRSEVITGDETWLYHYDVETKRSSAEWVPEGGQRPLKARRSRSQGKRTFAIFFDSHGVVAMVKLQDQATVTARWYVEECLPVVISSVTERAPRTGMRGRRLHHDNAPAHTAAVTRQFLDQNGIRTLPHPPYSPDLAPCDFWLFPKMKESLKGRRFQSDKDLEEAAIRAIEGIPVEEFRRFMDRWLARAHKCLQFNGDYFEGL